jgi:hypothetical protein
MLGVDGWGIVGEIIHFQFGCRKLRDLIRNMRMIEISVNKGRKRDEF